MPDLVFSVDSALLSELGEKLVERVHVALLELVKNAYDADAQKVTVRLIQDDNGNTSIHVEDDGSGMTYQDVKKFWMRIATTNKRSNEFSSAYGRPRAGSKGIGRFSCRRLGEHLKLITVGTRAGGQLERTEVKFDWMTFTPGSEVTTIACPGTHRIVTGVPTGTELIITGGKGGEWNARGFNYLKRQLALLVANRGAKRRGFEEDPGFNITIEAPGFDCTIKNLRRQLLAAGWGVLNGEVDDKGVLTCHLKALRIGTKKITCDKRYPRLRGTMFRIGILTDRREQMRDTSILSQGTLSQILDSWGGVYVFARGFRVYPYGEAHNDWLRIDEDRGLRRGTPEGQLLTSLAKRLKGVDPSRVLLQLLSRRTYVGDVRIGAKSEGFEPKASREGFVGSSDISSLQEVVRFGIDWATIYRDYYLRLCSRAATDEARKQLEVTLQEDVPTQEIVKRAVQYVRSEVINLTADLPTKKRQEVTKAVATATQAILAREQTNAQELRHLRLVASTSTLLLIFSHEVKSFLAELEQNRIALDSLMHSLPDDAAIQAAGIRDSMGETKERFIGLLDMTALIGVDSRAASETRYALAPRVRKAAECFELIKASYDISLDYSAVPTALKVGPMQEAEIYAILLNIISNSVKSVIASGGTKEIRLTAESIKGGVCMHATDTGIGISGKEATEVFVPFVADPNARLYRALDHRLNPEDKYIVGTGSGLGLSIVKEILQVRGGSVRFVDPVSPWKADLEVVFP